MAKYKKGAVSWAMYDWANSAWATTVLAGFYPVFFTKYWAADLPSYDKVAYLGYANSAAALCVFLLAAVIGAIADKGNRKKRMVATFAGMGIVLTGCLFWVARGEWLIAAVIYAFSYIFWLFANIAYDSLIVSVSDDNDVDRVSSLGYSLGYLGGGLLFTINVVMFSAPQLFGLVDPQIATLAGQIESHKMVHKADLSKALKSYNAQKDAKDYEIRFDRASLLEADGKTQDALLAYHELQLSLDATDPKTPEHDASLETIQARLQERHGQIDAADQRYRAAIEKTAKIESNRTELLVARAKETYARFLSRTGKADAAITQFGAALASYEKALGKNAEWDEKIIPSLKGRSDVYLSRKDFANARKDLDHIARIRLGKNEENKENPENAQSHYELAAFYQAKGELSKAEAEYKKAYEWLSDAFEPDNEYPTEARARLASFYAATGRFADARKLAKESWRLIESSIEEGKTIADYPKALGVLQLLVDIEKRDNAPTEAQVFEKEIQKILAVWKRPAPEPAEQIEDRFGLAKASAVKWSFLSVAIWWAIFMLPLLFRVKDQHAGESVPLLQAMREGVREVVHTAMEIRKLKVVLMFLLAYWFYIDGVDTIIAMAVGYGSSIGIGTGALIGSLLIVQFVSIPFALLFGWGGQKHGPKIWILIGLAIYITITFYAALYLDTKSFFGLPKFLYLALMIGMAQGGVQALSRSFFARIIPEERSAEFFGFYNMIGKFAAFIGPALMGTVGKLAENPRMGIMAIVILFVIGGTLLLFVDTKEGEKLAQELDAETLAES